MINEAFLVTIDGKQFVCYAGLLDLAHSNGLQSIEVEVIQLPRADNNLTAVCKAVATFENGRKFVDFGDASHESVDEPFAPHIVRLASTRAKARVLRDAVNVGLTAVEELGKRNRFETPQSISDPVPTPKAVGNSASGPRPLPPAHGFAPSTPKQRELISRLARSKGMNVNPNALTKAQASNLIRELTS